MDNGEPLGCWCVLDIAAQVPEKRCWLREHGFDQGWYD